jgi:hypothetical protein
LPELWNGKLGEMTESNEQVGPVSRAHSALILRRIGQTKSA